MKARDYLSQLSSLKEDIRRTEERIREVNALLTSPGAVRYDKVNVQTSPENIMENTIVRKIAAVQKLEDLKSAYQEKYIRIMTQIDGIEDVKLRRILKYRYVDGKSVSYISRHMHYSIDWTWKLLSLAHKAFEIKYPGILKTTENHQ